VVRTATVAVLALLCGATHALAADHSDANEEKPEIHAAAARPMVLPTLYTSLAALQFYDGYSTLYGQSHGARETNPTMQWVAASSARVWTVKAATTAVSIAIVERMWKRNRLGAIVTMAAVNGLSAAVALHNASVLQQAR
jgi:Domain of unknown function (DUF5658)